MCDNFGMEDAAVHIYTFRGSECETLTFDFDGMLLYMVTAMVRVIGE